MSTDWFHLQESAEDRLIPESSLGQVARRSFVPAAMRSNFFIGVRIAEELSCFRIYLSPLHDTLKLQMSITWVMAEGALEECVVKEYVIIV